MKLNGALSLKGVFNIKHFRGGRLLDEMVVNNTITNAGIAGVAGLINAVGTSTYTYMALGSSATAAVVADTALAAEITSGSLDRIAATATRVTTTVTNDTDQLVKTWSSTATQAVQEVGVFDTSTESAGTMISRATFTAKNLVSGDTLQVTHKIVVS
jgi:hypothetical protein|tara:strand:- start:5809 stop:6279 length:471 start_codon:yes stop_codon:yes gene_type:complete